MGGLTGKKIEFKSQVPHVMLHLNPGVARQFNQHASKLNRLKMKAGRTAENRKIRYLEQFEERRRHREKLYGRLIKIDDETRKAVDRITTQRRQMQMEEPSRKYEDHRRRYPEQDSKNLEMPESPTTAMNSDRAWGDMDDMSRRSSLRSTSIADQGPDSPTGPAPTDNPWAHDVSRRSSHGSARPEVLVTTIASVDQSSAAEEDQAENAEGKMTMTKLMSLLPAPIPTRFIGKMHAVVSHDKNRKASTGSDMDIPDTISENPDEKEAPSEEVKNIRQKGGLAAIAAFGGKKSELAMKANVLGKFRTTKSSRGSGSSKSGFARQHSRKSDADSEEDNRSVASGVSTKSRKEEWRGAAKKSIEQDNRSGSPTASEASTKKSSITAAVRKISPSKSGGATPSAKSGKSSTASKKRGAFANKMSRFTKDQSFGPTGGLMGNVKSLQSATMVVGRFMKKKSNKKTDDEVLAGFGAEHESSEEDFKVTKNGKAADEPAKKSIGGLKNKFGKMASMAKRQISTASDTSNKTEAGGEDNQGVSLTMLSKMATFQKSTKILIAAAYVGSAFMAGDTLAKTWMTGIPTSIRFLGRSCKVMPRGPGGLVLSQSPPAHEVDFSNTVNMLQMVSKADVKLKTAAMKESHDSRPGSRSSLLPPSKSKSHTGSRIASPSSNEGSTTRADAERKMAQMGNKLELEDSTKKLMENLINVRPASIPRWNEHKDVKEDKERDPCFFGPHDKFSEVDPKRQKPKKTISEKSETGASSLLGATATSMLVNMAIRSFKH